MRRTRSCFLLVAMALTLLISGCVLSNVYSHRVRDADFSKMTSFYVLKNKDDTGGLEKVVAETLTILGRKVEIGTSDTPSQEYDAIVSYEFQWFWDMGTYLLLLKIYIRDAETKFPYAMGESLRTSLDRKPPAEMAWEILDPIFNPRPDGWSNAAGQKTTGS